MHVAQCFLKHETMATMIAIKAPKAMIKGMKTLGSLRDRDESSVVLVGVREGGAVNV